MATATLESVDSLCRVSAAEVEHDHNQIWEEDDRSDADRRDDVISNILNGSYGAEYLGDLLAEGELRRGEQPGDWVLDHLPGIAALAVLNGLDNPYGMRVSISSKDRIHVEALLKAIRRHVNKVVGP